MANTAEAIDLPPGNRDADGQHPAQLRDVLGVGVRVWSKPRAFEELASDISKKRHRKFAFLNAHGANLAYEDVDYSKALRDFVVLPDGIGVDIASKCLYGEKFPDNLRGTDFIPELLESLGEGVHVALLGARSGVASQAAEKLQLTYPQHRFSVVGDGYFNSSDEADMIVRLRADRPDILLVALGNPMQEKWIARHCTGELATAVIGVGALFDFIAGRVSRAPQWCIDMRMEWVFRLLLEPRRMWRRYVLGNPKFLYRVARQAIVGHRQKV
ncbi:MAG: WecB/TagA/CpsF family glycosyltransferase [Ahrensia sp.]|nr:WecB/TagA/CpsF family glycosyltransferase [Ahrensia sp.]